MAPVIGGLYESYADQGLVVVTLLHDFTQEITVDEQNVWANTMGLAHPVVEDNDYELSRLLWPDKEFRPESMLVGPGAVVLIRGPEPEDVEAVFQ